MFGSIAGWLALAGLCSVVLQCRTAGPGWLVFGSIAGWLTQAGLCLEVLQEGWPMLACVR